eukprot:3578468-Pleurochrysis_carterae.AAC.1
MLVCAKERRERERMRVWNDGSREAARRGEHRVWLAPHKLSGEDERDVGAHPEERVVPGAQAASMRYIYQLENNGGNMWARAVRAPSDGDSGSTKPPRRSGGKAAGGRGRGGGGGGGSERGAHFFASVTVVISLAKPQNM